MAAAVAPDAAALPRAPPLNRVALLRRVCQRTGVQVLARSYAWAAAAPFAPDDVQGLAPVVKTCMPAVLMPEVAELRSRGVSALAQRDLPAAYHAFSQARDIVYQVVGLVHRDVVLREGRGGRRGAATAAGPHAPSPRRSLQPPR
jgi:protein TIF31